MRSILMSDLLSMLWIGTVFVLGCSGGGNGCGTRKPLSQKEREALQNAVAITLPNDVCLVASNDGGGRDPSYGFYVWTVYSKSGISFVPSQMVKYEPNWWGTPNIVAMIKCDVPDLNIEGKHSSSTAVWVSGGYEFRGHLLMTGQGHYLNIQRFRDHGTAPASKP